MTTPNVTAFMATAAMLLAGGLASAQGDALIVPMGTLAHATQVMEQDTGGKVLDIRLADEKGDPVFEAAIAKDDEVVYVSIASVTDSVTAIKVSELPPWLMNYKLEAYMKSIHAAKVPLTEAILKAEKEAKAPAIGAGIAKPLGSSNAVLAYYIETIKGKKRQLLAVDARNGAMIANPEAVYEHWTPVKVARRLAP